jgi:hypothetical protein
MHVLALGQYGFRHSPAFSYTIQAVLSYQTSGHGTCQKSRSETIAGRNPQGDFDAIEILRREND